MQSRSTNHDTHAQLFVLWKTHPGRARHWDDAPGSTLAVRVFLLPVLPQTVSKTEELVMKGRRAPGFGVGTEINPGCSGPFLPHKPDPTQRIIRDGVEYEIKPLKSGPRCSAVFQRVVRVMPLPDWARGGDDDQ
jgi:hypothetical protein